jgi:hypothetical protein
VVRDAGRTPRQRTTLYGTVEPERLAAARRGPWAELPLASAP